MRRRQAYAAKAEPPPVQTQSPEKKDRNDAIKRMRAQGYTLKDISRHFGISVARVSTIARR